MVNCFNGMREKRWHQVGPVEVGRHTTAMTGASEQKPLADSILFPALALAGAEAMGSSLPYANLLAKEEDTPLLSQSC